MPEGQPRLTVVPIDLNEACAFIAIHHRHHKPPQGHKFSIGVADETGTIRGVATIGRPVARLLDKGFTLELTRVATDGCPNACSALSRAAWRATRALGYTKLITYTLKEEGGASLRGAGWKLIGETRGDTWNRPNGDRPRVDLHPLQTKMRWEIEE